MSELDNLAGGIVAVAVGGAAAAGVEAVLEPARQEAWKESQAKVLDVGSLARLVAQAIITSPDAEAEAQRTGYNVNKVAALVQLAMVAPPVAETLELWRRGQFGPPNPKKPPSEVTHALDKAQIEPQYHDAILELFNERLSPQEVALGIVRSLFPSNGLLVGENVTTGGVVAATTQTTIDPIAEALAHGIDTERLRVMVGEIGLPMSPLAAASAVFREIIKKPDFYLAIAQGDTRPAWADAIFDQARQILTASEYAELQLRGFMPEKDGDGGRDARRAKTAQTGMSNADSDLLYNLLGRSIPVHQITTGLARGGEYKGKADGIPEAYLSSLQRGNLRPEYYNLAYANRYSLPSAFVIRALLTGGAIKAAEGESLFLESGWKPSLAKQVADFYGTTTAVKADPYVTKAESQLWGTLHRSYIAGESDEATASSVLGVLGLDEAARSAVVGLWQNERELTRKQLTAAQVKKAYAKAEVNPATGAPWTREDALSRLIGFGYSTDDANSFLDL